MLANIPPKRLPTKREAAMRQGLVWAIAAAIVACVAIVLWLGHGSTPAAVAVQPAVVNRVAATAGGGDGGASAEHSNAANDYGTQDDASHMFHGYQCTVDCSAHKLGYHWAHDRGISDAAKCPIAPSNLMSLTEGCWAEAGREGPYGRSR